MSSHNRDLSLVSKTRVDLPGAPRRRRWAPKVRTGCLTCKIRRVKCDETKPSCEKCVSTGRKCDGYEDEEKELDHINSIIAKKDQSCNKGHRSPSAITKQQRQQQGSNTFASITWMPFYGGELEKRNFDFFQSVTSSSLAGFYGGEFWTRETLQVAHEYPALYHAITAFGSIHHDYLIDDTPSHVPRMRTDGNHSEFGLQEFNKAIKAMYKLIAQEKISFRDQQAILTTCLLFTCLSTLQGRQFQAFMHVKNGMKLIQHWQLNYQNIPKENKEVVDRLLLAFIGLDTQIRPYIGGQEALLQWTDEDVIISSSPLSSPTEQRPFESLFDAYFNLEVIFNKLLRLNYTDPSSDEWALDIQLLVCQNEIWDTRFSQLLSTMISPTASELDSLNFIRLRREYMRFFMSPFTAQGEDNVHDGLSSLFLTLLDLAQKVLEKEPYAHTTTTKKHPIFTLGSTVIEILYIVATRSRDPSIRRQALHMMKLHPRREGICESMTAVKMVQRMIDIEEQGCPRSTARQLSIPPLSSDEGLSPGSFSSSHTSSTPSASGSSPCSTNINAEMPCSEKGKWVCEMHRVVDSQYLLYTERQLKVVNWTLEDRILDRKGREMVLSWW